MMSAWTRGLYFNEDGGEGAGATAVVDAAGADAPDEHDTESIATARPDKQAMMDRLAGYRRDHGLDAPEGQDDPGSPATPTAPATPAQNQQTDQTQPAQQAQPNTPPKADEGPVLKAPPSQDASPPSADGLDARMAALLEGKPADQSTLSPPSADTGQPQIASAPQAQPPAPAQAGGQGELTVPFSDVQLKELADMDPGMEQIAKGVNGAMAPLLQAWPQVQQLVQAIPAIQATMQFADRLYQDRALQIQHEMSGLHGELGGGGFSDVYGDSFERQNDRQKSNWQAVQAWGEMLYDAERAAGRHITPLEAMKSAHRILNKDRLDANAKESAVQQIRGEVQKRHAQTDVVPGSPAGSQGSPRDRQLAAVRAAKSQGVL